MPSLFFVAPVPLRGLPSRRPQTCARRPRPMASATSPDDGDDRQVGEPSWMDLARNIGPNDAEEVPRPPPVWEFPDGDPKETGDDNPWNRWNSAMESETPLEERDIKAETDFWRSAARDIVEKDESSASSLKPPVNGSEVDSPPRQTQGSSKGGSDDILDSSDGENRKSEEIWRMAQGVTGEMTEMQDKLRSELEKYNPDENKDQYRDIARELVGPANDEPWENSDPTRSVDQGAEAGTGWNPDVDWMRFEDMRREQLLEVEKAERATAEQQAREQFEAATVKASDPDSPADSESDIEDTAQEEVTGTFTEQAFPEEWVASTPPDQLPGFLKNRFGSRGTYGAGWSGAEDEARNLQEQGVPLRDPKADADAWRSVARELNLQVESEINETESVAAADVEGAEGGVEDVRKHLSDVSLPGRAESSAGTAGSSAEEESSWSSWRSGAASWAAANEKLEQRNPQKEVDMWRASAKELTGSQAESPGASKASPEPPAAASSSPKSSAWDQWREANAQWESSVAAASEGPWRNEIDSSTSWGRNDSSDSGADVGKKATSERSAWEKWNSVSGLSAPADSSLWWNTRTDVPLKSDDLPDRSFSNTDEWRLAARESLSSTPQKKEQDAPPSKDARIERDSTLDSWRSIAKDLMNDKASE